MKAERSGEEQGVIQGAWRGLWRPRGDGMGWDGTGEIQGGILRCKEAEMKRETN